ncbi:MAG: branched-chain amino acid ABC transporter permease [Pseudanabaenaceae cyanobacterium SKYGB_i_bin29]|nr:branched-chain amino acid ABC transporter permease [Pseudanabaenaceae cyanobacterium SKYG29]MDW8421205.1 branched-chain amino acid ABC transporter permease [Pseudanabaenaceae cyanobacterium SKYGB_i_bin29]
MDVFWQQLANGISIGSVYAIFALGYTLVFSVLGIINFAHGAIFTLGAYLTYCWHGGKFGFNGLLANQSLPKFLHLPFPLAVIAGSAIAGLVSVAIERWCFRPLRYRQADSLLTLISSLGVAVVIVNLIQYLVGAEIYTFKSDIFGNLPTALTVGNIKVRTAQVLIFAVSVVILALLTFLLNYTKWGKALQAVAEDPNVAILLGIDPDRFITLTFFLSGFLGGVAGSLVGASVSIAGPYFGISFGLKGLAVIVLGGLGSIGGAVLAGFTIGIAESLVPAQWNAYREAVAFGILFLMLLLRPQGLFGHVKIKV